MLDFARANLAPLDGGAFVEGFARKLVIHTTERMSFTPNPMDTDAAELAWRSGNRAFPAPGPYSRASAAGPFYDAGPLEFGGGGSASRDGHRRRLGVAGGAGAVVERPGVVVVDVGAGESTSLGVTLTVRNPSLTYVPVDIRSDAVDTQRRCGFDGRVGSATDLPLGDGTVDVVHARFVFGWLDPAGRRPCRRGDAPGEQGRRPGGADRLRLEQRRRAPTWSWRGRTSSSSCWPSSGSTRTTGDGWRVTFAATCPPPASMRRRTRSPRPASAATEPIRQALGTIGVQVAAVVDRLSAVGLDDDADQLTSLYAAVTDYGRRHPETPITFPTMVATTVDFTDEVAVAAATTAISRRRRARRRADTSRGLPPPARASWACTGWNPRT